MRTALFLRSSIGAVLLAAWGGPARGVLISGFEGTSGIVTVSSAAPVVLTTVAGQDGNALQFTYDLTLDNFAGIIVPVEKLSLDADGGSNALRFDYRASGPVNTVEISFTDTDSADPSSSDKLIHKFLLVPDGVWRDVTLALPAFITYPNGGGSFGPRLGTFSFGVTRDNGNPGSGTVSFDNFRLVRAASVTALIDGSENSIPGCVSNPSLNTCVNDRVGPQSIIFGVGGAPGSTGFSAVVSTTALDTSVRETTCTVVAGGFCFLAEVLGGMKASPTDLLKFRIAGPVNNNALKVELKSPGSGFQPPYYLNGIAGSSQTISIPLSSFTSLNPAINLAALSEVVFVMDSVGPHRFYFDDLRIESASGSPATLQVLEDFSGDKGTAGYGEYTAVGQVPLTYTFESDASVPGSPGGNRVGRIDYAFDTVVSTPYAVVEKALSLNLAADPAIRFKFLGTGGNNVLEVKMADTDGTVYRKNLVNVTDTGGVWREARIPLEQFAFFATASDTTLDLDRIANFEFIVSRGERAPGLLVLDTLESYRPDDFSQSGTGRVVTSVSTPNNPFSPNGDGVGDAFQLLYTLSQPARTVFRVYNLQGSVVRTLDGGDQPAGDRAFEWDGRLEDGTSALNGIYFYTLEAQGSLDGSETFKQVVAVLR